MENTMELLMRSLSPQESRIVLTLTEQGWREIARPSREGFLSPYREEYAMATNQATKKYM